MVEGIKTVANFFVAIWQFAVNILSFIMSFIQFLFHAIWSTVRWLIYLIDNLLTSNEVIDSMDWFLSTVDWVYSYLWRGATYFFLIMTTIILLWFFTFILKLIRWNISWNKSVKSKNLHL